MSQVSTLEADVVKNIGSALNASTVSGGGRRLSSPHFGGTNRCMIAVIVYFALFLDNVLLTVIVPILPDYLASINDRMTHHTSLDTTVSSRVGVVGGGLSIIGGPLTAQNLAYRNFDGSNTAAQQNQQTVMTKHPIPGKSMVNFSLLHASDDKALNTAAAVLMPPTEPKQQRDVAIERHAAIGLKTGNNMAPNYNNNISEKITTRDEDSLASENGSIGVLLAMKALVQLIFNPIVGNMSTKLGYRLPIVFGTFCLLLSSLVFAIGETYSTLLLARAVQGIGSACIGVCGMSLVAQHYPEEDRRSKVMGIILGSIALGVLVGYPFGGVFYDLIGKSAPFIILSTIIFLNLGLQLITMDLSVQPEVVIDLDQQQQPKLRPLLESKMILAIVVAIWFSTSTMAILEPCLPIWLMQHLKPNKWQLGTVFIPDSVGYFVGTNFFGSFAYKYGQVKISCISLLLVGISSILIPSATTVAQLLLPHFGLGLGIGIIDAALVPLLATFVDATLAQEEQTTDTSNSGTMSTSYGTVYAIQQTSVSLAYCLDNEYIPDHYFERFLLLICYLTAPLIGGELAQTFGFAWLMRIVGFFNIAYGPILVYLYHKYDPKTLREKHNEMLLTNTGGGSQYKKLYNSVEVE